MSAPVTQTQAETVVRQGRRLHSMAPRRPGRFARRPSSVVLTLAMSAALLYCLVPLVWLVLSSSKSNQDLFSTFGLWIGHRFALFDNLKSLFRYDNGIYLRWMANSALYAGVGASAGALFAASGGFALAKYRFWGRQAVSAGVLGTIMVPATALAVPTFLLVSKVHLVNTIWAVLVPSMVSPFGLYLMRVYAAASVPDEVLEAARIDGSSELRAFWTVALPLLLPGMVTVFLFQLVATWNNFFLPLIVLNNPNLFPLTVGLNQLNAQAVAGGGAQAQYTVVLTGSLVAVIPLMLVFLVLQRYWQSGLTTGSLKQ